MKSAGVNGEIERNKVAGVLTLALREDKLKNDIGNSNSQYNVTPYVTNKWMKIHMLPDTNSKYRNNRTIRAQADLGTDIDPNRPKTIGQERAMVLSCPAQIEDRIRNITLKKNEASAKKAADVLKAKTKLSKAAAILKGKTDLEELDVVHGPPTCSSSCRNVMCISRFNVPVGLATTTAADAKASLWNGCPTCSSWFCGTQSCQKQLIAHRSVCNQQRSLATAMAL